MIVQQTHAAGVVPGPRIAEPAVTGPVAWAETWQYRPGARPCVEYWDVAAARWRSCPQVPGPRPGD